MLNVNKTYKNRRFSPTYDYIFIFTVNAFKKSKPIVVNSAEKNRVRTIHKKMDQTDSLILYHLDRPI